MKRTLTFFVIMASLLGQAQTLADTITLTSTYKGFNFYQNGHKIKADHVLSLMESNDSAWDEFNSSREAYFFGNIFGILGSALVIYPFAKAAITNSSNYDPVFAGLCFLGISIPIFRSYNKKTISSIYLYNTGLKELYEKEEEIDVSFGTTPNGLGLKVRF